MRSFFGGGERAGGRPASGTGRARQSRHSSGWKAMLQYLKENTSLRVLDFGPTSAGNINMLTNMGHSIYMANLVEDAAKPEWIIAPDRENDGEDAKPRFDVEAFIQANLDLSGRFFDVVLLWDTLDYLPGSLVEPIVRRLHAVTERGGQTLAFFHTKLEPPQEGGNDFFRYHLVDADTVEMQRIGGAPVQQVYHNRQIETLLKEYAGFRFFLAKDNMREVIATR